MLAAGCGPASKSARGFRLPDGNIEQGKAAFIALQCHQCHQVEGVELPAPECAPPVTVTLGGEVLKVKTYGDLVTSIINPSHRLAAGYEKETIQKDGHSLMKNFNDVMTVNQLIDLVAFLQSRYLELNIDFTSYP
jgi:mono/diheme cytochrome c family protein